MQSNYDIQNKTWNGAKIPYPFSVDFMVGDWIYQNIQKEPNKIIQIEEPDGSAITCEELRINSIRIAQNLAKFGFIEDEIISIFLKNSHLATYIINACVFMGIIINPLDADLDDNDIYYVLNETRPKMIICESENVPKIQEIIKRLDLNTSIYTASEKSNEYPSFLKFLEPTFEEEKFILPKFSKPSDEKILAVLCSSGTTGRLKGVCVSHIAVLSWFPLIKVAKQQISFCYSPLYWGSGFFRSLTTGIVLTDLKILPDRKFSVDNFIEVCLKYKVTNTTIPPSYLAVLLNSEKFISTNIDSLNTFSVVGSILSKALRKKFEEIFPEKNLIIGYIMTEASVAISLPMEYRRGLSVGSIIFANNSVKIVDDDGKSLDNGEPGEICVKSFFKFLGYYNNPEATKNALDNEGYIKTGDIGYFDDSGMLYVIDRKKEIVKYKGIHVNPSDVEEVIYSINGVQHVSVVGIPDDFCYNLLAAGVVKLQGYENLSEKDIVQYVASRLPEQKQLHGGVYFFNELPMTLSGKIKKKSVLDLIQKLRS